MWVGVGGCGRVFVCASSLVHVPGLDRDGLW